MAPGPDWAVATLGRRKISADQFDCPLSEVQPQMVVGGTVVTVWPVSPPVVVNINVKILMQMRKVCCPCWSTTSLECSGLGTWIHLGNSPQSFLWSCPCIILIVTNMIKKKWGIWEDIHEMHSLPYFLHHQRGHHCPNIPWQSRRQKLAPECMNGEVLPVYDRH